MMKYGGSEVVAPRIPNLGEWSASRPGEPPVPIWKEAVWLPKPIWRKGQTEKFPAPVGNRTPVSSL
jgi:hypothetical protein